MANKLTVSALRLQEKLSNYHNCPYILYWETTSTSTSGGKYATTPTNSPSLILWYLSVLIICGGIFICCGNFVTLFLLPYHRIPIACIGFSFFMGCLGCLALGINIVFFYYADNFAESLNGLVDFGEEIAGTIPQRKRKNKNDIIIGLFALSTVIFLNIVPFIAVPVWFLQGWDPTVWILKLVLGQDFETVLWPAFKILLLTGRIGVSLLYLMEVCRTICAMCLIMILESPIFFLCLFEFSKETANYQTLMKYWELCTIRNINVKSCGQMTGVAMGTGFVMMTFTHVACLYFWDQLSAPVLGCLMGATVVMDCMIHIVLPWVTKLYDMSSRMIIKWKKEQAGLEKRGWKRRYLGMMLKATRPIAFSVGSVGVLKQETKLGYFQAIQGAFFDLAMGVDGFKN